MADIEEREGFRAVNWPTVALWTGIGIALLAAAEAVEVAWAWTGVSVAIMVHIGGTLLLAPLVPFLEEGLTRRVVAANRHMIQVETTDLRTQVASLATRIDEIQRTVDDQEAAQAQDEDRAVAALGEQASFTTVATALAVANQLRALATGEVVIRASLEPHIDIAFSWHEYVLDRPGKAEINRMLEVKAYVDAHPAGGGTPAIQTIWKPDEAPEAVIQRLNAQLRKADRWPSQGTINWGQIFRDLHTAIELGIAYKRRDSHAPWMLHGAVYEIHGDDWAITEAGIEYRPDGEVVLAEHEFPEETGHQTASTDAYAWPPAPPEGASVAEWQHVLERGRRHLPVWRGPMRTQPVWRPSTKPPEGR